MGGDQQAEIANKQIGKKDAMKKIKPGKGLRVTAMLRSTEGGQERSLVRVSMHVFQGRIFHALEQQVQRPSGRDKFGK